LRERTTRSHEAVTLVTPAGAAAKNTGKARAIAFRSSHSEFGSSRAPDAIAWIAAMLDLVLALLAGILTIAAPCTLPVLPILLGASVGQNGKVRPAMIALGFVLSFSAVALLLGAITKLFDFDASVLRSGAALLLLGFGALMIWPAPFEWVSIRLNGWLAHGAVRTQRDGVVGGFVLGTTLGLVWTPCAGPVLGSILTLVATARDTAWASLLVVTYASARRCRCSASPMAARPSPPACAASRACRRA
jgi:cytochrome c-type biogenesis protein